ncbi:hypothetical protein ACOMHN_024164 [Nucella lapillus]
MSREDVPQVLDNELGRFASSQHGGKAGQFYDAAVFPTAGSVFFPDSRSLLEMEILCPSQSSRSHRGLCSQAIRAHKLGRSQLGTQKKKRSAPWEPVVPLHPSC